MPPKDRDYVLRLVILRQRSSAEHYNVARAARDSGRFFLSRLVFLFAAYKSASARRLYAVVSWRRRP